MKPFKTLTAEENKVLLKFPVYITLLASNLSNKIDDVEKKSAITFSHIKTFSCDPLLKEFYSEVDKVFEINLEKLNKELPQEINNREESIKKELLKLNMIVSKLGKEYSSIMELSMKSFSKHVSNAHHNAIVDFILPISIHGLNK